MFRCKECGTEYEIKPEYCDCGNDTFEEIIQENSIEQKSINTNSLSSNEQKQSSKSENDIKSGVNAEPKIAPCKPNPKKQNLSEQYPEASRFMHSIDPISSVIFCICLILSFYVIFFAWNPSEQEVEQIKKAETNITKKIPAIESFWNNTPPKNIEKPQIKPEENKSEESVTNVVKQIPAVKPNEQKKVIIPVKKVSTLQKTSAKTKVFKTTPVTKPKAAVSTQVQNQAQKASEEAAKKQAVLDAERKAAEAAQLKKLQEEQAKKAAEQKAKQSSQAKQEFFNYKAQLRNTIGRKVDFTRVIGDGSCTVSFKIDSNGKLTNRSFTKQSSNNTLNDAVYAAVMATPNFTPPPSYYNNETLNLTIRFYNGNFEISLP